MFDAVKLALLFVQLAVDFLRWVKERHVRTDAQRELIEKAEGQIRASIEAAEAARARVRGGFTRDPDSVRNADEFTRPDG